MSERMTVTIEGGVAAARLRCPDKLNGFGSAMFDAPIRTGVELARASFERSSAQLTDSE